MSDITFNVNTDFNLLKFDDDGELNDDVWFLHYKAYINNTTYSEEWNNSYVREGLRWLLPPDESYYFYDTNIEEYNDGTIEVIVNQNQHQQQSSSLTSSEKPLSLKIENNDIKPSSTTTNNRNLSIKITPNFTKNSIESIQILELPIDLSRNSVIQSNAINTTCNDNESIKTSLILDTIGDEYILSLNLQTNNNNNEDNLINIPIPNKKIGEKLEKFINKYGFIEFINNDNENDNNLLTTNNSNKQQIDIIDLTSTSPSSSSITTTIDNNNILCTNLRRRSSTNFVPTSFLSRMKNEKDFIKYLNNQKTNFSNFFKRSLQKFRK